MCTATSTLLFGITVKAMDFCLVAAAYKRSRPALLAIDLILARRARGRLEVKDSVTTDVRALPVEVWELVRAELIDKAFDHQLKRFVRRHGDPDCGCDEVGKGGRSADVFACEGAWQGLAEGDGVAGLAKAHVKKVEELLADFGLCLASHELISTEDYSWADLQSSWAIALPLALDDKGRFPFVKTPLRHEWSPTHALADISPSTFVLPADAHLRFRRLLSTFPILEPVSHTSSTIRPRAPQGSAQAPNVEIDRADEREQEEEDGQRRKRVREAAAQARRVASEPRWMLWTEGGSCI
ncbi:hypothetical protein JCM8208_007157 [Rhodotorula glutinis]